MKMDNLEMIGITELVDRAIALDRQLKNAKRELEKAKTEIQRRALLEIENKNLKYLRWSGSSGCVEVGIKEKVEIDNYSALAAIAGLGLTEDKIARKVETKYDIDPRFKQALTALYKGDYAAHNIDAILSGLALDTRAIAVLKRRFKGDYRHDKNLLENFGISGAREEELDAIRETKNMELVARFFDPATVNVTELQRALHVEEGLSLTLTANE